MAVCLTALARSLERSASGTVTESSFRYAATTESIETDSKVDRPFLTKSRGIVNYNNISVPTAGTSTAGSIEHGQGT